VEDLKSKNNLESKKNSIFSGVHSQNLGCASGPSTVSLASVDFSHQSNNVTFTTLNSDESHPSKASQIRKQLRPKQRNVHVTNLKRNKKLWQIEKATLQEGKRIKEDLGKLQKAMMI
jgi:hypothetical protein